MHKTQTNGKKTHTDREHTDLEDSRRDKSKEGEQDSKQGNRDMGANRTYIHKEKEEKALRHRREKSSGSVGRQGTGRHNQEGHTRK